MFFGSYFHNLDDKGRLVIPSKMRDEAGLRVYIMRGHEGSISIYRKETFDKKMEEISKLPYNHKSARDFIRLSLASVYELDVDKQGRVQIPNQVLNDYQIDKDVAIIGVYDHIEVWSRERWLNYLKSEEESFDDNAEKLPSDIN